MNSARLIISALFLILMTWLWYPYFTQPQQKQTQKKALVATPDYIATELRQTVFDVNGQISHKVAATKMEQYQELGFTHFSAPIFTLYSEKGIWTINASEATLYDSKKLILEGNVEAINLDKTAMIQTIQADYFEVDINQSTMNSERPVTITGPNILIKGKGLIANFETEVIELINHTQTIYYDQ